MDTGCSLEDQLEAIDDRDEWQDRVREIHASAQHDDDNISKQFAGKFIFK